MGIGLLDSIITVKLFPHGASDIDGYNPWTGSSWQGYLGDDNAVSCKYKMLQHQRELARRLRLVLILPVGRANQTPH